jgi:probable F420-dependent oxidoreductase
MQYGAMIPNLGAAVDPVEISALTQTVEEAGYDTLMVSDHVILPTSLESRYPYNSSGIPTFNADHDILEPFTLLCFLAGITQRVRLGISVQVLPYRHPVLNTKMITTLDVLSQGRIIVGTGVGWMREEFEVLDSDFPNRGTVTDEHIQLFKLLCTEEDPVFHGQHYHLEGFKMKPKPVQKPHPPLWIGGTTGPGKRRAAAMGQGWHAVAVSPEGIRKHRADLMGYLAEQGRDVSDFTISLRTSLEFTKDPLPEGRTPLTGTTQQIIDDVKRYQEVGLDHMSVGPRTTNFQDATEYVERFASEVIPKAEG